MIKTLPTPLSEDSHLTSSSDGPADAMVYDPAGNVRSQTSAGITTQLFYNAANQQTTQIDASNHVSGMVFGLRGETLAGFDGNGNGSFSGFNNDGQQTASSLATGGVSKFQLDALGQTAAETDPNKNITTYQRDADGNVLATVDPLGNKASTTFDANNNPLTTLDADGRKITDAYDAGNRLSGQLWLSANGAQADAQTFGYDKNNNLTSAANTVGSYAFVIDPANRVTRQTDPLGLVLNFTNDANGNPTQISDSAGGTQTNVYDANNRLQSRRFSVGSTQVRIDLAYTAASQLGTLSRYSDTAGTQLVGKTQNTFDAVGNLTEEKHTNAANTVLEDFQYTLDAQNRLTSETDTISGTATTTGYGYDVANQLTSAGAANYSYDKNGNRTITGYQVGPNNQLLSDGAWNYKYDPAGNQVEKDGVAGGPNAGIIWIYGFDNQNNLISATETNGSTQILQEIFSFDVFGNRLQQDVTQSGTTTTTKFAFGPGGNIWADLNASNQVTTRRQYLDTVDAVFARIGQTGTVDWDLGDHLGSIRGLMNNSGTLDDAKSFDAWGNLVSESTPANGDRMGFAGGQWDANLGQYHDGRRQLTPATATWTSQDPLGLGAGPNRYQYVSNAPTNFTDPSGLQGLPPNRIDPAMGMMMGFQASGFAPQAEWARAAQALLAQGNSMQQVINRLGPMPRPVAGPNRSDWLRDFAHAEDRFFNAVGDGVAFVSGLHVGVGSQALQNLFGLPDLIWNLTTNFTGTIGGIVDFVSTLARNITQGNLLDAAGQLIPDLPHLLNWDNLRWYNRGYYTGRVMLQSAQLAVGAYGAIQLVGRISRFARSRRAPGANCFPPETLVATETGLRPIAKVRAGEKVWAFDFQTATWRLCNVESRHDAFYDGELVTVDVGIGEVRATKFHAFWVEQGEDLQSRPQIGEMDLTEDSGCALPGRWVSACDLRQGDVVFLRTGQTAIVRRVSVREERSPVCNLTVGGLHSFAVGEGQVLVHNTPGSGSSGVSTAQSMQQQVNRLRQMKNQALREGALSRARELALEIQRLIGEIDEIFGTGVAAPGM